LASNPCFERYLTRSSPEMTGSLCEIRYFDLGYFAVVCGRFPVKFFPLDFENKFYCFFDIGERFFPGLTLADRAGDLDALDRETTFFLGFEHPRIFHRYTLFTNEDTIFLLGFCVPGRARYRLVACGGAVVNCWYRKY